MLLTIGFAVAAEDIRHFQLRAIHRARRLEVFWVGVGLTSIETGEAANPVGSSGAGLCWSQCGDILMWSQAAMAEQELNVRTSVPCSASEPRSMTQRMWRNGFRNLANMVATGTRSQPRFL